eukprot:scaffold103300_cov54-Phaeocystis_antarctica.AAC.2
MIPQPRVSVSICNPPAALHRVARPRPSRAARGVQLRQAFLLRRELGAVGQVPQATREGSAALGDQVRAACRSLRERMCLSVSD